MKKVFGLVILAVILSACAGPKGDRGDDGQSVVGPKGDRGETGAMGADGEIARVVPLCPGTSNYGVFIEIGLCINNQLFGVYSANGGFLTLLAPGNYSSNAIGSACNLTVEPNCVVVPR